MRRGRLAGWRLALRLARRDATRHRVRSLLALAMITLPVLGVVAADVLIRTADVDGREGLDRRLGTVAAAKVTIVGDRTRVQQAPDPGSWNWGTVDGAPLPRATTLDDVRAVLGPRPTTPAPNETAEVLVGTDSGREAVAAQELDPRDPLAAGLFRLTAGRWPRSADEVVVNGALADRGPRPGDVLEATGHDGTTVSRTVVGTAESASLRSREIVVGLPGSLPTATVSGPGVTSPRSWLVGGGPVTWADVRRLNDLGVVVTSRQVVLHPDGIVEPQPPSEDGNPYVAVAALVATMALIEVVLLAGPAFAVGARRQQRALALVAASGGTPRQARRVILAGGLVLGVVAAAAGVVLGLGAAWVLQPVVQRFSGEWLGPFDVPWLHLAGIAAFGVLSALLAAVVPAWIASRQDVVAVLAGRRGDPRPSLRSPVIGVLVLAAGVGLAALGAHGRGTLTIAVSALVCVLGMLLLVPVAVATLARSARRLPLPLRFAARDAARHRTRTTPAVAAVAATVAGVVALGIAVASDEKQSRETYEPSLVVGDAAITPDLGFGRGADVDWSAYQELVARSAPAARVREVRGLPQSTSQGEGWTEVTLRRPGAATDEPDIGPWTSFSALGTDTLVSDGTDLPAVVARSAAFDVAAARRALAAGRAVVLTSTPAEASLTTVVVQSRTFAADAAEPTRSTRVAVPALVLVVPPRIAAPVRAMLPPGLARRAHVPTATVSLELAHPRLSEAQERDLRAELGALAAPGSLYAEHGYRTDPSTRIIEWVLAALGAVLMLGGTLTATFLALSDAKPDLATLAAVGAAPRTRRAVGAAYALTVGLVGAVLGALVGAVPGVAVTYPLTDTGSGPFLAVPWALVGAVVLGLPLLTAALVGLVTRSRLPMVARLG